MNDVTNGRLGILVQEAVKRIDKGSLKDIREKDLLILLVYQQAERHKEIMAAFEGKGIKVMVSARWAAAIGTAVLGLGSGIVALATRFQWW